MDNETRERIEKEAEEFSQKTNNYGDRRLAFISYSKGAIAEHSRITELLKEERNRVIDEVLKLQFGIEGPHGLITVVRVDEIESLKGRQQ